MFEAAIFLRLQLIPTQFRHFDKLSAPLGILVGAFDETCPEPSRRVALAFPPCQGVSRCVRSRIAQGMAELARAFLAYHQPMLYCFVIFNCPHPAEAKRVAQFSSLSRSDTNRLPCFDRLSTGSICAWILSTRTASVFKTLSFRGTLPRLLLRSGIPMFGFSR